MSKADIVTLVSFVTMAVVGVIGSLKDDWLPHSGEPPESTGHSRVRRLYTMVKRRLTRRGWFVFSLLVVAFCCGLASQIKSICDGTELKGQVDQLVTKNKEQADSLVSLNDKVEHQVGSLTSLNAQIEVTNQLLALTQSQNEQMKKDIATGTDATKKVGDTIAMREEERRKKEEDKERLEMEQTRLEEERQRILAEQKRYEERLKKLRREQQYMAVLKFPKGSVAMVENPADGSKQQKNVFLWVRSNGAYYTLQCEAGKGVYWGVGVDKSECALAFEDGFDRQAIPNNRITVVKGRLKFNGSPEQIVDVPFPGLNGTPFFKVNP